MFTLESANGEVLGCRVIGLRVCACPGRDRDAEETAASRHNKGLKRRCSYESCEPSSSAKPPKTDKVDNQIFTLKVCCDFRHNPGSLWWTLAAIKFTFLA